jgi:hypothetical protein
MEADYEGKTPTFEVWRRLGAAEEEENALKGCCGGTVLAISDAISHIMKSLANSTRQWTDNS